MKKYLAGAMAAIALLFGVELGMEHYFDGRLQETAETMAGTVQQSAALEEPPEIYALFGVDTREGDAGRSDCILLLSFAEDTGTVRMCSIARDTMVTLPGEGTQTKLGHAYALGGPEKAMETINENFGLNVTRYTTVNFSQMAQLVDLLGGVEVPLTQKEWDYMGLGDPYLGTKHLDGEEALCYCRIRSIDSDDMRTARQRRLIAAMLEKVRQVPRSQLPELLSECISLCRTNIGLGELLHLGKEVLAARDHISTVSMALPGDAVSAWGGIKEDGVWYYVYDLDRAAEVMGTFFSGENDQSVLGET